jgi:Phosphotransferase enzyme family
MTEVHDACEVVRQFQIEGEFAEIAPYGSGHINDSYCAAFDVAGVRLRYMLQRINNNIFKAPIAVMENIQRVTEHLAAQSSGQIDAERRVLRLVPTRNGKAWYMDANGHYWRVYHFIEKAHSLDAVESPEQAFRAAKAFGQFQKSLADLPTPRLHDVIPDFHHTPKRFAALEHAVDSDLSGRVALAQPEIQFTFARKAMASALMNSDLPERVTHNDTKLNNVLLDDATGEGLCVVDLDTVMPGLALHDFGDMVRTMTSATREDEQDLSRVTMEFPMFEALVRGYLTATDGFLTAAERQHLVIAAKVMTFEQGIRFLTDYLAGDTYYKVHRDGQNLDRCRTQFKLLESIEQQEGQMNRLVLSIGS